MLEKDSLKSEGVSGLEFRSVTVLRNNAFRDISDTSIKEYLLKKPKSQAHIHCFYNDKCRGCCCHHHVTKLASNL